MLVTMKQDYPVLNPTLKAGGRYEVDAVLGAALVSAGSATEYVSPVPSLSQSGGVASIKSRIAASAATAYRNNPVFLDPWFKPKVWVASTWVKQGEVWASTDGINQFICRSSGVTGATSPAGTPLTLVTDGTAQWVWMGPIRGLSAAPQTVYTQGVGLDIVGGQSLVPRAANTAVEIVGTHVIDDASGTVPVASSGKYMFITDSTKLLLKPLSVYWTNELSFSVSVNNRLIQEGAIGSTGVNGAGAAPSTLDNSILIDLSSWGGLGVEKEVIIYAGGPHVAKIMKIDKGAQIKAHPRMNSVRALWDGSSLLKGGNNAPYHWGKDVVSMIGALVGQNDWGDYALGGTGIIGDGGSNPYGPNSGIGRIASNVPLYKPEFIVRCDNHNDSGFTSAQRLASVGQYVTAARSAAGNQGLPVVFFGNTLLQGESSDSLIAGSQLTLELELKSAVSALNDSNVFFIPVLSANPAWVQAPGATPGHAGNITGYNADRFFLNNGDGHPASRGYDYYALQYATAIARWASNP